MKDLRLKGRRSRRRRYRGRPSLLRTGLDGTGAIVLWLAISVTGCVIASTVWSALVRFVWSLDRA